MSFELSPGGPSRSVVIVDYGVGNLNSMLNMLRKIGAREARISGDPNDILSAAKLILPGVGAFDRGMENLRARGLIEPLTRRVMQDRAPILGVCLGMQLFTERSEEGSEPGLGWIDASTVRFDAAPGAALKVPHMGWNWVEFAGGSPLGRGLKEDARFYFVHSYHVAPGAACQVAGTTEYCGIRFSSAIEAGNIFGVQFHPEKSHSFGMRLLSNFVEA